MKIFYIISYLLISCGLSAQNTLNEKQLTATVQLIYDTGPHGSGFFFRDANEMLLVSAKHVLIDPDGKAHGRKLTVRYYSSDISRSRASEITLDFAQFDMTQVYVSESSDIAMVRFGSIVPKDDKWSIKFDKGITRKEGEGDIITLNEEQCLGFDTLQLASSVFIFGYPVSLSMKGKYDSNRPLLRRGAVAGKNYEDGLIIVDCQVDQGVSGSPVFIGSENGLKLVGIVTEMIPFVQKWENQTYGTSKIEIDNSGYSVVEPIDLVLSFLRTR